SICSGRIPCGAVVNFARTAAALSSRAVVSSAALAESATALIKNKNCVTFTIRERPLAGPLNWDRSRRRRVRKLGVCWLGDGPNRVVTLRLYIFRGMRLPSDILVQLGRLGTLLLGR